MATCVLQIDDLPPARGVRRVRVTAYCGPSGLDLGTQPDKRLYDIGSVPRAVDLIRSAIGAVGAELDLRSFEDRFAKTGSADETFYLIPVGLYEREERSGKVELTILPDGSEVEIEEGAGGSVS